MPWRFSMNFRLRCPWMSWLTMLQSVHAKKASHQPVKTPVLFTIVSPGNQWQQSLFLLECIHAAQLDLNYSINLQQVMAAWAHKRWHSRHSSLDIIYTIIGIFASCNHWLLFILYPLNCFLMFPKALRRRRGLLLLRHHRMPWCRMAFRTGPAAGCTSWGGCAQCCASADATKLLHFIYIVYVTCTLIFYLCIVLCCAHICSLNRHINWILYIIYVNRIMQPKWRPAGSQCLWEGKPMASSSVPSR